MKAEYTNEKPSRSLEAEQAVVGAMLIDDRAIPEVLSILNPEDFSLQQNTDIFEAICTMFYLKRAIDPVLVLDEMKRRGTYDESTTAYMMKLMEITPTAANVGHYAEIVKKQAARRALFKLTAEISRKAATEEADPAQLLADMIAACSDIANKETKSGSRPATSEQLMERFLEYRNRLERGEDCAAISTGFKRLDGILGGGMVKGGLYILAARPGVGKTTLGLQIADRVAAKRPVLFVTLEMQDNQLSARRVAENSGMSITTLLLSGDISDAEQCAVCSALSEISQRALYMSETKETSIADIALMSRQVSDLALVVIDYLGLIKPNESPKDSYERITKISGDLKRLALSLGVPVLCLAQLNRASEQRADKQPIMADLRDSGAIEQDADGVILLHRPEIYKPMEQRVNSLKEPLQVIVAKNRHGAVGRVTLDFYPRNGRLRE